MDTKSKNIKYSLGIKIIAVFIMWASTILFTYSGVFLINNLEMIRASSYYDTYEFQWQISRLTHNVLELHTRLIDQEHIKNSVISQKTLDVFTSEKNKIDEIERNNIINEKLIRLAKINENLSRATNFNYYLENLKTGEVYYKTNKNYNPEIIKNQSGHIYLNKNEVPYYFDFYDDIEEMLTQSPHELYVLVQEPLQPGDGFYDSFHSYSRAKRLAPYAIAILLTALILMITCFFHLVWVSGKQEKDGEIILAGVDKIYNDVQLGFILIAALFSMNIASGINFSQFNHALILELIVFSIDLLIGITFFFSMLRQYKKGVLLKNTLVFKISKKLINFAYACYSEKIFKSWIIVLFLGYGFANGILCLIVIGGGFLFGIIPLIGLNSLAVYFIFKSLKSLTKIMEAAKEISVGNLEYQLDKSEISMEFMGFAENIKSIQGGLKYAVNEAIKGERMKTDLITNVSHDLKTPLTSIINYIDLLKRQKLNNEIANGYVNILEEKSERLKQLIEDLIEASKASSGTLTVTMEQVDLNELIVQACGEYEDKLKAIQLEVRINACEERILVRADGKYMWRILENLMSNVLKYSMPNSRIYINVEKIGDYGVLIIKNISSYPLDIAPNQLTERFIRADQSRSTDGSGLGLSIAQSLTTMLDGRFNIEIDGDLFKAIVEIPLWLE